mgnify:CR=1 FL=1
MVYKTDGSSHHNGVANEKSVVEFVNNKSVFIRPVLVPEGHALKQVGGTKTKIDAQVVDPDGKCVSDLAITIKNHKGLNGTFDWLNTTENTERVKERLKEFKAAGQPCRKTFNEIFASHLKSVDDSVIRSLLRKCADENPSWLVINNASKREYVLAKTPDLTPLVNWTYFLKFGRGKTSAQIWRRADGNEVNTRIRLRLVSNNGLAAVFTSKGSVPCFKIQQEHVKNFIESLPGAVRETWT